MVSHYSVQNTDHLHGPAWDGPNFFLYFIPLPSSHPMYWAPCWQPDVHYPSRFSKYPLATQEHYTLCTKSLCTVLFLIYNKESQINTFLNTLFNPIFEHWGFFFFFLVSISKLDFLILYRHMQLKMIINFFNYY